MKRILIVDGSNLLFQMFFGMPARIVNSQGKAIQGVLGFVGAFLKIVRKVAPTHIIVLFDGQNDNNRSQLNGEYKANRIDYSNVPDDKNPYSQLEDIYSALNYLKVKYAETTVCETDDLIASYALTYGRECEIVISSFDSDFFQFITDKVSVLRYRGEKTVICTPDYIKNKFNILPSQYADFKSLVGDSSDNIKGAENIGPKIAAALLNEYKTLDGIIENAEFIMKPSIKVSVLKNREKLKTNYRLIKLDDSAVLPFSLDELEYQLGDITTNEILKGIGIK